MFRGKTKTFGKSKQKTHLNLRWTFQKSGVRRSWEETSYPFLRGSRYFSAARESQKCIRGEHRLLNSEKGKGGPSLTRRSVPY